MKEFLAKTFYGNTIQDWLISFGILLGAIIIGKIIYWAIGKYVKKITAKTKNSSTNTTRKFLAGLLKI